MGDLGTLLPLVLGAIAVAGLAPMPVLLGFALFYIATAVVYRLPVPVQPMKVIAALLMTDHLAPGMLAASGVLVGAILIGLALTGWIDRLARLVPQSVLSGLQLGLGISLALVAWPMLATSPVLGVSAVVILGISLMRPGFAGAALVLLGAGLVGGLVGAPGLPVADGSVAAPGVPVAATFGAAFGAMALPQLALTLANAVFLTAFLARDYFGEEARHVTPRRLSLTTGIANVALTPFGALPMCHGAGGLAAHHRFGARSGGAPLLLGLALLALACLPAELSLGWLAAIPAAVLGALLVFAACELALSKRLFDARPSCQPVIAVTALATLAADPMWGLILGTAAEMVRKALVRRLYQSPHERP